MRGIHLNPNENRASQKGVVKDRRGKAGSTLVLVKEVNELP